MKKKSKPKHKISYIVEKHLIKPNTLAWFECDELCFKSKNLYNQSLYRIRKHFFETKKYLQYTTLQKQLQNEKADCYTALNSKNAQLILKRLDKNFKSFFELLKIKNKGKYNKPVKIPHYKNTRTGRSNVIFNIQSMSKTSYKKGYLKLTGTSFELPLQHTISTLEKEKKDGSKYITLSLKEAEIIPYNDCYMIIIKHEIKETPIKKDIGISAGIDLGVNNLVSILTNSKVVGHGSFLLSGKPLKSINHYYNKVLSELKSELELTKTKRGKKNLNKEIKKLCRKRNNKVNDYLHKASHTLTNHLDSIGVHTLIIGKNIEWKQEVSIGKRNNQNFVQIPHARFIDMIIDKWKRLGHVVVIQEESYTSKCSFLDREKVCKHTSYVGKRVKRGLFRTSDGLLINADTQGAGNILRKAISNAFDQWSDAELIQGFVVSPIRLTMNGCYLGKPKTTQLFGKRAIS